MSKKYAKRTRYLKKKPKKTGKTKHYKPKKTKCPKQSVPGTTKTGVRQGRFRKVFWNKTDGEWQATVCEFADASGNEKLKLKADYILRRGQWKKVAVGEGTHMFKRNLVCRLGTNKKRKAVTRFDEYALKLAAAEEQARLNIAGSKMFPPAPVRSCDQRVGKAKDKWKAECLHRNWTDRPEEKKTGSR